MFKCSSKNDTTFSMVREVQENPELVSSVYDSIIEKIITDVSDGHRVEIRDFGVFSLRDCRGYVGKNPMTSEVLNVPAKKKLWFTVGRNLALAIDKSKDQYRLVGKELK